ncbi:MAG: type II and III secretion system protein family protein [Alphaproteobacteria bacterium]|nr:type II and III secretion system protein family protein [Alphaproteobacteria bacterium]
MRFSFPTFFRLFLVVLALGLSPVAHAAVKKPAPPAMLDVAVDKGVPVKMSAPAASVFIANPDVADVQVLSPTSVMVFGKKTGQTTLIATDNYGQTLVHRTVLVTQNLDDLRIALRAVIPDNKIGVDAVPNGIVLTGEAKDPAIIEDARRLALRYVPKEGGEIINRIKVRGSNQIMIRVRFAEVSRDVDKRFGIDWESIGNVGGFALGLMSGNASTVISSGANLLDRSRPVTGSNTNDIISFSKSTSQYNINGLIDALAADGLVTLLAEPSLTAMSGQTASFLAGGEFPIPVPQQNNVTIEWKQYGISLAFTPTLVGENRLSLHVRPEVSQLSEAGAITLNSITVPALTTRRAETTIELGSGQSFALAGLLNNNQTQSVSKYPFLGDMPILGTLFRSTRFQNNETELVIIITPYIVKPTTEENLALPTDGFSPPSDTDRIFRMRATNSDPEARVMSGKPRAVPAEPALIEEAPVPTAAPVSSVTKDGAPPKMSPPMSTPLLDAPIAPAAPSPTPSPKAVSAPSSLNHAKPAGPGGFILE